MKFKWDKLISYQDDVKIAVILFLCFLTMISALSISVTTSRQTRHIGRLDLILDFENHLWFMFRLFKRSKDLVHQKHKDN